MPAADWSFLQEITLWQLAIVVIAIWVLVKGLVNLWPGLRKTIRLIDSLGELPGFIERTEQRLDKIGHQVQNDHESNLRDDVTAAIEGVDRLEIGVRGLYDRIDQSDRKLAEHVRYSEGWKHRLDQIDERTQPPRTKE